MRREVGACASRLRNTVALPTMASPRTFESDFVRTPSPGTPLPVTGEVIASADSLSRMIRLRTLGTLDLTQSDGPELRAVLSQPRRMALLVYLAVATPRGFHRRDHLVTLFWPEDDIERARASLNRAIYFLRRELGDGVVLSRGAEELGLNFERLWCDAAAFDDALDRLELTVALELYRGDLLPGFFASRAEGFERWLETARSHVRERAAAASWSAAAELESRGDLTGAAVLARRAAELAPFDEVGVRRLITLLDRAGDRAGAVRCYQEFAERMAADLELAPSPETKALIEDIRSREQTNGGTHETVDVTRAPRSPPIEGDAPASPSAVSTPRLRRSQRRIWGAASAAAAIAAVAWAFGLPALARVRSDPRAVYVVPFANRTSANTFDDLGRVVADRITQSLSATGLVDALPPDARHSSAPTTANITPPGRVIDAADRSRAGTIVSGEFHIETGRIVFQAWITDARRNRVAWAVQPTSSSIDSAGRAIDEVSRRVTGAVAALRRPSFASWFPIATSPPTFEAFQEFAEATDLQSRGLDKDAIPHLRRAAELDTTFIWARMQLALAHLNLFEEEQAEALIDSLNVDRARLNPLQRHWLAWMLSFRTEDHLAGYRAIRAAAELAPERFLFNVAQWALRLNRPRESIALLERLGPRSPHAGGPGAYWDLLTRCYHAVGDGQQELRAARDARRANIEPMRALSLELRAMSSLGRADRVQALLDTALALPVEQGPTPLQVMVGIARVSSPAQLMVAAAQELRAHGHERAAQDALARALAWYRSRPAHESTSDGRRFEIAHALYLSRNWEAADTAFHALAALDTANYIYLGFLGTIAARRGDSVTARRVMAKFDTLRATLPEPRAVAGYWQSKISSILGDEQRALTSMTEVWGQQGVHYPHMDFDYERMWNVSTFRAFIRPKG
jgi:DNA-binding SARP family transcriptional activator